MAEPNEGYIRLHRRLWEHPYWQDPERLRAWIDCLLMAAWKPHRRLIGATQVDIGRGEFIASDSFLTTRWGWSRGKARRFMAAAEEAGEIETRGSTAEGTRYLVVKYGEYQRGRPSDDTDNETPVSQAQDRHEPGTSQASDTIEGRERREEEGNNEGGGGQQPPTDWKAELRTACTELAGEWCDSDRERRGFRAATESLLTTTTSNPWRNPHTGERIPEADRPALYRTAALRHFEKPAYSLDQSLTYVLKSTLDPGNDPEAKKRSGAAGDRRQAERQRQEAEVEADQLAMKRWEQANPDEAERIRQEAEAAVEIQGLGRTMMVKAETSKRIREAMSRQGAA